MANSTTIRLPDDLHERVRTRAFHDRISINAIVIQALKAYLDHHDRLDEVIDEVVDECVAEADHARALEKGLAKVEAAARGEKPTKTVGEA